MKKRLAIQLFGHLRTYRETYQNFLKNIVEVNQDDGWDIDIFLHTWDKLSSSNGSWHKNLNLNCKLNDIPISNEDIQNIKLFYKPKKFLIEELTIEHGRVASMRRVNDIKIKWQLSNQIKYDYNLFTRPDIMFMKPFKISSFFDPYKYESVLQKMPLCKKHMFTGSNIFRRMCVADPRYINEWDLIWIASFDPGLPFNDSEILQIPVDYRLYRDFFIWRDGDKIENLDPFVEVKDSQLKNMENEILIRNNTIAEIKKKYIAVDEQSKEANIKTMQLLKDVALSRIQNQLSYKLGQAMIVNSKSILGYIRMPFVLSYIKDKHKQEQKIYQEKIKKDPSLKLPPLEDYPDYQEVLKEKECLTYKLGEALIKANKIWYKGGYIKLLFEIGKLKREYKKG
ncbi:galactosyltransferase [Campylobacter jejuni]|nr:galactosyltransferase [Campylobacter jejuni]EAI6300197.1 galactosyltransferase [Campylobacter jejuni]EAI6673182.1 galactosyltransferase [Campylobacter jejuni]EAJ2808259.1 galactosyltransferase [Campylobacter jejuni]EAJ5180567.1 galactosyltransferase [Campylobacter jejuni]